ncbi:MAG: type II toxin-antitoxin system VapC family toxin [Bryobacteraceae bacterium]
MRALDSNVLVRYLVADDPRQAAVAERIIEECRTADEPLFITVLVLSETVWVLSRVYQQSKIQIVEAVETLLGMDSLRFEHDHLVRRAFDKFRLSRADFPDYLIGEIASAAGCRDTVTFDRALKGSPGFTIL